MTFNYFLPPKTFAYMIQLADQYGISTKEVERIILNKALFQIGMVCEHKRIGYPKNAAGTSRNKPFCKDCWTRLEIKEEHITFKGRVLKQTEYKELQNEFEKDLRISAESTRESKIEHEVQ